MAGITALAEMFLRWEGCEQKAGDSALLVEKAHKQTGKGDKRNCGKPTFW